MSDQRLDAQANGTDAHQTNANQVAGNGVTAVSYLLAGIGFYGALGWGADHVLGTHWCLPIGLVLGAAAAVYLIITRFGGAA